MAQSNAEAIAEIRRAHMEGGQKHTYFLLAAAGAAIGFAVQKTEGIDLDQWALPVASAVLCWGLSFYCGCKNVSYLQSALGSNFLLMQLHDGVAKKQPDTPEELAVALRVTGEAIAAKNRTASVYSAWQFRFLLTGSGFFILWHVLRLWRNTT